LCSGIGEIPAFLQALTAQYRFLYKIAANVQLFVSGSVKSGVTALNSCTFAGIYGKLAVQAEKACTFAVLQGGLLSHPPSGPPLPA
jgi:hypothetical protein